jgi:hypothetical protein
VNKFGGTLKSLEVKKELTDVGTGGLKDLKGKCPIYLAPFSCLVEPFAWVAFNSSTEGGGKYPMNNWKKGIPTVQLVSSAIRHLVSYASGEKKDAESGMSHLWHALWNVGAAIWMTRNRPEMDEQTGFDGGAGC